MSIKGLLRYAMSLMNNLLYESRFFIYLHYDLIADICYQQRYIVSVLLVNTFDIDSRSHRLFRDLKTDNCYVNEPTHSPTYFSKIWRRDIAP